MRRLIPALFTLLVACGGTAAPVKRAPPPTKIEVAPPPPAEPSAFEQRWSAACGEGGAVGQCPAPFDRPGVFVDVGEGEQGAPPFCGAIEAPEGAGARDALKAKRRALKACFRGAEPGSYVELGDGGVIGASAARKSTARIDACVAKIVDRAFKQLEGPRPERVLILQTSAAKPGD